MGGNSGSSSLRSPEPVPVSAHSGDDPGREAAALHGDIKLMLLASPSDKLSELMPAGMSVREWKFATESGAYRQVYRPALKEFGFQLTAKGRKLKAALVATQSTGEAA